MSIKQINSKISYIAASNIPLSSDIGIINNGNRVWLYDVGNDSTSIQSLTGKYHIVLSHFHLDHIGNLNQLNVDNLYVSRNTFEYIGRGIIVERDIYMENLHIFPLPSSHTKGSLGLEIDEMYAFVGDALYSKSNAEYYIYNAQLLKEELEALKRIKAKYLLVSHLEDMLMNKEEAIQQLESIYARRDRSSHEILVKRV